MNPALTTPSQEPKGIRGTRVCREHLERTAGQVRAESSETRVQMEEEGRSERRVHLDHQELQDSQAAQVLQAHRVPEGSEVNPGPEESPAFLDLRVDQDFLETREQPDAAALTDRRANQEIQVIKVCQDPRGPEGWRVRMAKTVTDLKDLKDPREILVSLVTPGYRARTACRDPKDTRDPKATGAAAETRVCRESRACLENLDIQDTRVPEVLQEAKP